MKEKEKWKKIKVHKISIAYLFFLEKNRAEENNEQFCKFYAQRTSVYFISEPFDLCQNAVKLNIGNHSTV